MKCIVSIFMVAWAATSHAGEPKVVEQQRSDGLTELRVVSEAGQAIATYTVNLIHHQEPATSDTGRVRQWESYRFGGFVCFNDNQFVGRELSQNKEVKLYNPTQLDVAGWAVAMKNAGMKYAVLTTRHTSGFLLWDSATSGFDVASSPNQTDVVDQFVTECLKQGIAPGFYYCLWGGKDWMPHPNARAIILAQLHELASRFGEISCFWIDMGNWRPPDLSPQEIYDAIKNQQPKATVILNQHIQDGRVIHYFPTDVLNGEVALPPAGGHQPFRRVSGKRYYLPFEFEPVSQRLAPGTAMANSTTTPQGPVGVWFTYGDGRGFPSSQPLPAETLFDWIKQAYERGAANVLLSLAADHTGRMRPGDVRQLEALGKMLRDAGLLDVPEVTAQPALSLAMDKPVRASGVWEENVQQYGPAAAVDDDPATRWGGPVGARAGWLEVDLSQETSVARAVIHEGWDRTRKFSVQYRVGDEWRDAAAGTTLGAHRELTFAPVKARVWRLHITDASDVPTVWEFQLFAE